MNVLSYILGIILDCGINYPCHGNNLVDGINNTQNLYFKEQVELVGNLKTNDTSNIGILPYASKSSSIIFQNSFYILSIISFDWTDLKDETKRFLNLNKNMTLFFTTLKVITTLDIDEGKLRHNDKNIPLLNVCNRKITPYGIKGGMIIYHYGDDPNLGQGVIDVRIIP